MTLARVFRSSYVRLVEGLALVHPLDVSIDLVNQAAVLAVDTVATFALGLPLCFVQALLHDRVRPRYLE
jgi:hypothetical protein